MFSTLYGTYFSFWVHFKMSSAICFNLDKSKILSSANELNETESILPLSCDALLDIYIYLKDPFDPLFP